MHRLRWGLLLVLAPFCGCRTATREYSVKALARIDCEPVAVVPFESLTPHPNAGLVLAGQFANELRVRGVTLVPQDRIVQALGPLEGESLPPANLGALLGARTLLLGTVDEYRYKRGVGEAPTIGVTVRLVEAGSGRVLWSISASRTGQISLLREGSLSRLGQAICRDLAAQMCKRMEE